MSAFGGKADITRRCDGNVCFVPKADIAANYTPLEGPASRGRSLFHFGWIARVASCRVPPQLTGSVSAHVGCPLLLLTLVSSLWLRRQLKHRRLLTLRQQRQEYDLPVS